MKLNEILDYRTGQLCTALGIPDCHPVSKGDLSEVQWISFLKGFLPERYAVAKGFVFDSEGDVSDQIDIVIYDSLYSPLIFGAPNGEMYITAESVYAVFEVKQKLDKRNLEYARKKIESVKNRVRTSRNTISSGMNISAREPTNIIGGLLTNDSIKDKNRIKKLMTEHIVCNGLRWAESRYDEC